MRQWKRLKVTCRNAARWLAVTLGLLVLMSHSTTVPGQSGDSRPSMPAPVQRSVDFLAEVYPILQANCFACHQGSDAESGYRLDYRAALVEGEADHAPLVIPGRSGESRLIRVVAGLVDGVQMPPEGEGEPISREQLAILRAWIDQGVAWDQKTLPAPDSGSDHWSFQPVVRPSVPELKDDEWSRTAIDSFVLSRLHKNGLAPAREADRRTLIRRLTFVLAGLPPTPEEVAEFSSNHSPGAYEQLVDRLLDSPQFGIQLARFWLDVVRYAESEGYEYDNPMPGIWRYRDYVIDSLNADKPYDRFVREQLAGDELDPDNRELLVAAGFHRLGPVRRNAGNQEVASSRNEMLTERTNVIGSALLGLTIGCARCHDHRFDPIEQTDYYRLQAFFASSYEHNVSLASDAETATWKARKRQMERQIARLKKRLDEAELDEEGPIRAQLRKLENDVPPDPPLICTVVNLPEKRTPVHVLKRGLWDQPGLAVGMGLPGVLQSPAAGELPAETSQPRTQLAEQILSPRHPLTARVIVNRLWAVVMGQGIVSTPNDFGRNGDRPSHPELLDYLASDLVDGGWRIKPVVRQIVLSSTFRQASVSAEAARAETIDPDNRLLWRTNVRRLSAEEVRDAMLASAGRLNEKMNGPSVMVEVDPDLVQLLYKPKQWEVTKDLSEHDRRSVYLVAKRNLRLPFMEVFDQPDLQTSCARRASSTHALQALELLNGRLSNRLAESFAQRITREAGSDPRDQVERAFWLALSRPPTALERASCERFLDQHPLREFALALFNVNAFLYVN